MPVSHARAREMLEVAMRGLAPHPPRDDERLQTADVLLDLARHWPDAPTEEQRRSLDALCHKVHVSRVVYEAYTPEWRRLPGAAPLSSPLWRLLVTGLLAWSSVSPEASEDERGLALKCLNAGLAALALAEAAGAGDASLMRSWAGVLVASLASAEGR